MRSCKTGRVCRLDLIPAKDRCSLQGLSAGLLDVDACILKFRPHPFVFMSESFNLVCQPGDLFVEHIEIHCWRGWRGGPHVYVAGSVSQVVRGFAHFHVFSGLRFLVWSSLVCPVQSAVVGTLVSLQTVRNGVRVRTRRLGSEGYLIVAS